jgi:hydroxymethylbilane synthase
MPLAAYADWQTPGDLRLDAAWGDPDEANAMVRVHQSAPVQTLVQAEALGLTVASALRAGGARGV